MKLTATLRRWIVTIANVPTFRQGIGWSARYYTERGERMNAPTAYQLQDAGLVEWEPTHIEDVRHAVLTPSGRKVLGPHFPITNGGLMQTCTNDAEYIRALEAKLIEAGIPLPFNEPRWHNPGDAPPPDQPYPA